MKPRPLLDRTVYEATPDELQTPLLHIVAYSTPSSCALLNCWMGWAAAVASADCNVSYRLLSHLPAYSPRRGGSRLAWLAGIRSKVTFMRQLLNLYGLHRLRNEAFLFSDVDVVPMRVLSTLVSRLAALNENRTRWATSAHRPEIIFMEERHRVRGRHSARWDWRVNSGFYLLRNTHNVQSFLNAWKALILSNRVMNDRTAVALEPTRFASSLVQFAPRELVSHRCRGRGKLPSNSQVQLDREAALGHLSAASRHGHAP